MLRVYITLEDPEGISVYISTISTGHNDVYASLWMDQKGYTTSASLD